MTRWTMGVGDTRSESAINTIPICHVVARDKATWGSHEQKCCSHGDASSEEMVHFQISEMTRWVIGCLAREGDLSTDSELRRRATAATTIFQIGSVHISMTMHFIRCGKKNGVSSFTYVPYRGNPRVSSLPLHYFPLVLVHSLAFF
jgi:hypothetical protein